MRIWRKIWKFEQEFYCEEFLSNLDFCVFVKHRALLPYQILFTIFDTKVIEKFTFKFFISFPEKFEFSKYENSSIHCTILEISSYHASRSSCRKQKPAFVVRMHNLNFSVWQNTLEPGTTKKSITAVRVTASVFPPFSTAVELEKFDEDKIYKPNSPKCVWKSHCLLVYHATGNRK